MLRSDKYKQVVDFTYAITYNTTVNKPQIILDTNVIYTAQRSQRGASSKLMTLLGTGAFEIHISIPLILEYEDVLTRNQTVLGLNQDDIERLINAICAVSIPHKLVYFRWHPYLPDPKDEFILDLAVVAQCDTIITYNQKDFVGVEQFGIQVMDPKSFLRKIGAIT